MPALLRIIIIQKKSRNRLYMKFRELFLFFRYVKSYNFVELLKTTNTSRFVQISGAKTINHTS